MINLDDETIRRIDRLSDEFSIDEYFKRIKRGTRDVYDKVVALVITEDRMIARADLRLHVNAATEIYRRLYPDFTSFTDDYIDRFLFWGEEGAEKYGNVNMCLSSDANGLPMFIPDKISKFQYNEIVKINNLANDSGIEVEVNIPSNEGDYSLLSDVLDELKGRVYDEVKLI